MFAILFCSVALQTYLSLITSFYGIVCFVFDSNLIAYNKVVVVLFTYIAIEILLLFVTYISTPV